MEKCFNKLTKVNQLFIRLHVRKNEENLGFLQPLGWASLRQQLTAPIL